VRICHSKSGRPTKSHVPITVHAVCVSCRHRCGLAKEMEEWGMQIPSADQLFEALFEADPIEWIRIGFLQDVSMRLIANHILRDTSYNAVGEHTERTPHKSHFNHRQNTDMETYVVGEATFMTPKAVSVQTVFCSAHNLGASALVEELAGDLDLKVTPTSEVSMMGSCACFLVYLTSKTWSTREKSAQFADDVRLAMAEGLKLVLAHEMPGVDDLEDRHAINFGAFFSYPDGTTPQDLLQAGIYNSIALALKGGPWRRASLVMAANAFSGAANREASDALPQTGFVSGSLARLAIVKKWLLSNRYGLQRARSSRSEPMKQGANGLEGNIQVSTHARRSGSWV